MSAQTVSDILSKWQQGVKEEVEKAKAEGKDSPLDFTTLWRLTQTRIDTCHTIATSQAEQSFRLSQMAMLVGLLLVAAFGIAALFQQSAVAAIAAGSISVASGAVSAYISATFMRAQSEATAQMRQFFLQPVEFTRLLGAERLIEIIDSDEHKTEAVKLILQSMSFTSPLTPTEAIQSGKKAKVKLRKPTG